MDDMEDLERKTVRQRINRERIVSRRMTVV
jgi:hypothetical protein